MTSFKQLLPASLTLLMVSMSSCAQTSGPPLSVENTTAESSSSRIPITAEETSTQSALTEANFINDFAIDLYGELHRGKGNLFLSPFSLSSALAMTYAGARGETAKQMATALRWGGQDVHTKISSLQRSLISPSSANTYQLHIANMLWGPTDELYLAPNFVKLLVKHYDMNLDTVDFNGAPEKARQRINQWVAEKTAGQVKEVLPSGVLTQRTKLVLTNAIYFKGNWRFPFDEKDTQESRFTLLDGTEIKVPMMYQKGEFYYRDNADAQLLELPYKTEGGKELSMVVMLPKQTNGLTTVETKLTGLLSALPSSAGRLKRKQVVIYLPKFKVESTFQLNEPLRKRGMVDAFDFNKADFSGINGKRDLAISAVVHQAVVEVNEKGTEAAAGSAVAITLRSANQVEFHAVHPFLFLIRDNQSGTILFLGRVLDPRG